eukprot:1161987-Pelagomonas_calceolata.AAC.6
MADGQRQEAPEDSGDEFALERLYIKARSGAEPASTHSVVLLLASIEQRACATHELFLAACQVAVVGICSSRWERTDLGCAWVRPLAVPSST